MKKKGTLIFYGILVSITSVCIGYSISSAQIDTAIQIVKPPLEEKKCLFYEPIVNKDIFPTYIDTQNRVFISDFIKK